MSLSALLLLAGLASGSLPAQVPARGARIDKVTLAPDGPLTRVTEAELLKLVIPAEGTPYSSGAIRGTIRQLHATGLFFDVQARVAPTESGGVAVTFVLLRRYEVSNIDFEGDLPISRGLLRARLALRPRTSYKQAALEESLAALSEVYRDHGFYQPHISHDVEVDDERATVRVLFRIEAGVAARINTVHFESEPPELKSMLELSQLDLGGGQTFSRVESAIALEEIRQKLARQGYLRADVYFADDAPYEPATNSVNLRVRIIAREKTEIEFRGEPLEDDLIDHLPLFASTGPGAAFPPHAAEFLREQLQTRGHLSASVEVEETRDQASGTRHLIFNVVSGPRLTLRTISFEGNTTLSDRELKSTILLRSRGTFSGGRLTEELLERDVARLLRAYQRQGFLDAAVTAKRRIDGEDLHLVFEISEGPVARVRALTLSGVKALKESTVRDRMQLKVDSAFAPLLLADDRAEIIALYQDAGYRNVEFASEVERVSKDWVTIHISISENRRQVTADTLVVGNRMTKHNVIASRIELRAGTPFSQRAALQTEANLYDLAIFRRVRIRDVPSAADPLRRYVLVEVEEARQYLLQYGLGYSSFEGIRGTVGFSNTNLFGAARTLSLNTRFGARRQRANLSLTFPRPFAIKLPTVLSFSVDNEERVDIDENQGLSDIRGRPFDTLRYIASVQSEKRLSRRESLFYRYRFERVRVTVPEDLEEPLEFFRTENVRLSSLSLTYLNDSRNPPSDPLSGFFLNGEVQLAPKFLGSEAQFLRILTQGQYYHPLATRVTLAASLRIGSITPFGNDTGVDPSEAVPISERFFAGGASTLRGLPQDLAGPLLRDENGDLVLVNRGTENNPDLVAVPEGGNGLVIANLELRFPLIGFLGGTLFYDVGNVYRSFTDLSDVTLSHSIGTGLAINTPVGPLRFDLAYNPNPPDAPGFERWTLHFNLGHPF